MSGDDPYRPPCVSPPKRQRGRFRPFWTILAFFPVWMAISIIVILPLELLRVREPTIEIVGYALPVVAILLSGLLMLRPKA